MIWVSCLASQTANGTRILAVGQGGNCQDDLEFRACLERAISHEGHLAELPHEPLALFAGAWRVSPGACKPIWASLRSADHVATLPAPPPRLSLLLSFLNLFFIYFALFMLPRGCFWLETDSQENDT